MRPHLLAARLVLLLLTSLGLVLTGLGPVQADPEPAAPTIGGALPEGGSSITGRVTDEAGTPLEGIEVVVFNNASSPGEEAPLWEEWTRTMTVEGDYAFYGLPADEWILQLIDTDRERGLPMVFSNGTDTMPDSAEEGTPGVLVTDGLSEQTFDMTLYPAPEPPPVDATITGLVTDEAGDELDAISVQAFRADDLADPANPSPEPVASDLTYEGEGAEHGAFVLHVPEGEYIVRFSSLEDSDVRYETMHYGGGNGTPVKVLSGENVDLDTTALPRDTGIEVSGLVTDTADQPLTDAYVELYQVIERHGYVDHRYVTSAHTDEHGRYTLQGVNRTRTYTVYADAYGYDWRYLGDTQDYEGATTFVAGDEAVSLAAIKLPRLATVSGTVTGDGEPLTGGWAYVQLYRWYEWDGGGSWQWWDAEVMEEDGTYSFRGLRPGRYTVRAEYYRDWGYHGDSGEPYLSTNLGGGHLYPRAYDQVEVIEVVDGELDYLDKDIDLERGVYLRGAASGAGGRAVRDAWFQAYEWVTLEDGYKHLEWLGSWAISDRDGRFALVVPKNSQVFVDTWPGGRYLSYQLGGEGWPDEQTEENTLVVGETDYTDFEAAFTPLWDTLPGGAVQRDAHCLDDELWVGRGSRSVPVHLPWREEPLYVNASGSITDRKTPHYRPGLLTEQGDRPILAPFMARVSRSYPRWPGAVAYGIADDGNSVCVTWIHRNHRGTWDEQRNTWQAVLTRSETGGLDVTYNFDQVQWIRHARVGYAEGTGETGSYYTVPGFEGRGYRDDFESGLIHNSLGSDHPGRYSFHFDGFEEGLGPAPVNETAPSIAGTPRPGETLTADPGTWTVADQPRDDLEFEYFWYRLGGATSGHHTLVGEQSTYQVSEADHGSSLVVVVAAILDGHERGSAESAPVTVAKLPSFESVNPPAIKGDARYGETLTVTGGTWAASDGTQTQPSGRSYQWLIDGKPVTGSTSESYTPTVGDVGRKVSVQETVTADGMAPGTATSAPVTVTRAAAPTNTAAPTLTGTVQVGQVVTAGQGTWQKTVATRSYQWFADATRIPGATGNRYTPAVADAGKVLTVVETVRLAGHEDGSATSKGVSVAKGAAPTASRLPSVTGNPLVGQTLTAEPGSWSRSGLRFSYQWLRDGVPVDGATKEGYQVGEADKGRTLTARVTAQADGYEDGRATSQAVPVSDSEPAATNTAAPTISGTPKVGQPLTASPGGWDRTENVTFTYEWLYSWSGWTWPIWGAENKATFTPSEWQAGWPVAVRVTAARPGTTPVSVLSAATEPIAALPSLVATKAPSLAGEAMVGKTLTVVPGTWSAADPTLEYTWYADWVQVHKGTGAPGASYTPSADQRNRYLYVQVKASKAGYTDGYAGVGSVRILPEGTGAGSLGYTVTRKSGDPVAGAYWTVCSETGWDCLTGHTDDKGTFAAHGLLATEGGEKYKVSVWPNDQLTFSGAEVVTLKAGETVARSLELATKQPIPANATLPTRNDWGGHQEVPSVHFMESQTIEVTGCATVEDPRYTVTFTDGTKPWEGTMTMEGEPVDGKATFTASIAAFYPSHGDATISTTVPAECGGEPTEFSIYIDPSGIVTDQFGRPIEGANVTLYKADVDGSYTAVPDGSDVMSPDNRNNPSVTDSIGFFRWDVVEGWYKVGVTGARSGGASCADAMTNGMSVPPIRVDLLIKVECAGAAAPEPTLAPQITGSAQPGRTLTATRGIWAEPFVWQKTEWRREGRTVGTGDTYPVTTADQGKTLTALVTTGRPGYVQENGTGEVVTFTTFTTEVTISVPAAPVGGGNPGGETPGEEPAKAPVNTVAPAITGTPRVGVELTAAPGTWNTEGLTFGYQWLRNGTAIPGATTATYRPTAQDAGAELSVLVTASKPGAPDGTATSGPVTVARGAAAVPLMPPSVTGKAAPGRVLSASTGSWSAEGLTFGYQWLRDGDPITGATAATYVVRTADIGRGLAVEVVAARAGHEDGQAASAPVEVDKLASTTRAKVLDKRVRTGERGIVQIRVAVPGSLEPTGAVVLRSAGTTLGERTLRPGQDGTVTVRLPKLPAGSHVIRVVYSGEDRVARSTSEAVRLRVLPERAGGSRA